eukprot:365611-Chlamydomonas_euryale.AAC.16
MPTSGRRNLLMDGSALRPQAVGKATSAFITEPLDSEQFERFALSASGFDLVRPALAPSDSGDGAMHVVPFQTISWYPRITYYPGVPVHHEPLNQPVSIPPSTHTGQTLAGHVVCMHAFKLERA